MWQMHRSGAQDKVSKGGNMGPDFRKDSSCVCVYFASLLSKDIWDGSYKGKKKTLVLFCE